MEFRVLGPVEVSVGAERVRIGHAKQRSVLAVLLLDLGRVVSAEQLIDRVWGEGPPASVRNVLYGYVARLRAAIAGAGNGDVRLSRRPGGYLLEADPEQVDVCLFRRLAAAAAAAAGDDERAAALLRSALGLWHGPALAGLDSPWLSGTRESLDLQRVSALLDLGDITLRQGQHGVLISDLALETVAYPTDERMINQLMLALYRSGRQAEALRWFEQTRRRLAEEFGADPGPELCTLHQQILRADPYLARRGPIGRANGPTRERPTDVPVPTGRAGESAGPDRLLIPGASTTPGAEPAPGSLLGSSPGALPGSSPGASPGEAKGTRNGTGSDAGPAGAAVAVIPDLSGTAGVGETAPAVHWAHRVADRLPDGRLRALAAVVLVAAGVILGVVLSGPGREPSAVSGAVPPFPGVPIPPPCGTPAPPPRAPAVCASTADGGEDTTFVVQGSGFAPGSGVKVTLTVLSQPPARPIFHGTDPGGPVVNRNGTFRYVIAPAGVFFTGSLPLGLYEVNATESGGHQASTVFRVVPGP